MDALTAQFQNLKANLMSFVDLSDVGSDRLCTDTSRVYLRYDIAKPPSHPGKRWTRFICVSDTHGWTPDVPQGDVLIHAGDLTRYGSQKSFETTMKYLKSLPHPVKLVIAGNHDRLLDPQHYVDIIDDSKLLEYARNSVSGPEARQAGIQFLHYQSATVKKSSWRVYGSPATPWYSAGAFQYSEKDSAAVNSLIPRDTQILITHGPPQGVLDTTRRGKSAGCPALAARLFAPESSSTRSKPSRQGSRAAHPSSLPPLGSRTPRSTSNRDGEECDVDAWLPDIRLHVFGHIHEAWGAAIITREPPSSNYTAQSVSASKLSTSPSGTTTAPPTTTEPGMSLRSVETVFVNAAVQQRGSGPIIVDLLDLN